VENTAGPLTPLHSEGPLLPNTLLKKLLAACLAAAALAPAMAGCTAVPADPEITVPPGSATPSADNAPRLELAAELDRYRSETGTDFSVALHDFSTGEAWTYNPDGRYLEASLVKLPILLTLLRQATDEERELTAQEQALAELMICQSDNVATDSLYSLVGGAEELQKTYGLLGILHTQASEIWGANETAAQDQLRIAAAVARGVDWIRSDLTAYAVALTESVVPEQHWGITAGIGSADTEVGLKNGWLQDDALVWNVGSAGFVLGANTEYGIAILTAGAETLNEGIAALEGAAAIVNRWELGSPG